jgi:DNA-binding XRE family transcriptional regulator
MFVVFMFRFLFGFELRFLPGWIEHDDVPSSCQAPVAVLSSQPMNRPRPPTAWSDMIRALQAHGMTQQQIAARVGTYRSTIGDLATGRASEPNGWLAVRLWEAYRAVFRVSDRKVVPPPIMEPRASANGGEALSV